MTLMPSERHSSSIFLQQDFAQVCTWLCFDAWAASTLTASTGAVMIAGDSEQHSGQDISTELKRTG